MPIRRFRPAFGHPAAKLPALSAKRVPLKAFDLTGSERRLSRTVTDLVTFRRQLSSKILIRPNIYGIARVHRQHIYPLVRRLCKYP